MGGILPTNSTTIEMTQGFMQRVLTLLREGKSVIAEAKNGNKITYTPCHMGGKQGPFYGFISRNEKTGTNIFRVTENEFQQQGTRNSVCFYGDNSRVRKGGLGTVVRDNENALWTNTYEELPATKENIVSFFCT